MTKQTGSKGLKIKMAAITMRNVMANNFIHF